MEDLIRALNSLELIIKQLNDNDKSLLSAIEQAVATIVELELRLRYLEIKNGIDSSSHSG